MTSRKGPKGPRQTRIYAANDGDAVHPGSERSNFEVVVNTPSKCGKHTSTSVQFPPTPVNSSQHDQPGRATSTRSTRTQSGQVAGPSPAKDRSIRSSRSATRGASKRPPPHSSQDQSSEESQSEDSELDVVSKPTSKQSEALRRSRIQRKRDRSLSTDYDSNVIVTWPLKRPKPSVVSEDETDVILLGENAKEAAADDDDDDVVEARPQRRRLFQKSSASIDPGPSNRDQEEEDLEEDMKALRDTRQSDSISSCTVIDDMLGTMTTRTRGPLSSPTKTLKQKQLEKLRRRHGGEKHLVDSDSSSPEATKRSAGGLYDNDSDRDDDGNEMDLTWVEDDETKISATEEIRQILRDGHSDEYEEDFVDDEGDDTLGAPLDEHSALQGIPLEFTRHSHKKPKEHFQDAVKWMVHNKLDPAFPRDDAIYQVAFQKLDDEVQGRSRSTFISAAWTADFVRALRSRPDIVTDEGHSGLVLEHCEACNRVGHPATWTIHLTGKPYHRHTLEDVTDDEEDGNGDDDDDVDDVDDDADDAEEPSEHGSVDSKGNPLPSQHKAWCVGRHCGANAEMAHRLMHWRYASNHMVLTYLDKEGHMEAEQVIRRARWSNNKRSKFADIVLDEMVESGQVEMLYQDFKSTLHEARSSKPSRFSVR